MAKIKYVERVHKWKGTGIYKSAEGLKEIDLGVKSSDKKLQESGARELFKVDANVKELEEGKLIAIEVEKLADIETVYSMDSKEFVQVAKIEDINE